VLCRRSRSRARSTRTAAAPSTSRSSSRPLSSSDPALYISKHAPALRQWGRAPRGEASVIRVAAARAEALTLCAALRGSLLAVLLEERAAREVQQERCAMRQGRRAMLHAGLSMRPRCAAHCGLVTAPCEPRRGAGHAWVAGALVRTAGVRIWTADSLLSRYCMRDGGHAGRWPVPALRLAGSAAWGCCRGLQCWILAGWTKGSCQRFCSQRF
jgi:hypothetical protein